ncbi:MAG: hypothetical protein H7144_00275 [Burkholderiales bacterium]|nr:hypothetical protein [Phycisphaerae bacterium]
MGLGLGIVLTLPAIFIAILSGGAGHGNYYAAAFVLPWSVLFLGRGDLTIVLGLVQLPVLGFLVGTTLCKDWRLTLAVAIIHAVAICVALIRVSH